MAHVVLAVGTSHSPVLALGAPDWETRARNDRSNRALRDVVGTLLSYDDLHARVGDRYTEQSVPAVWEAQKQRLERDLDRLSAELEAANPDVVVIVGDDEHELFSSANMPALSIYYGEHVTTRVFAREDDPRTHDPEYVWMKMVAQMYGMETNIPMPGRPDVARALIYGLIDRGFDVGACADVPDPAKAGFGHAFGFVFTRLLRRRPVPIVPVMINTYYPPNQPTPARCVALGSALREAIEALPGDLRVAIVASGGLSHFVTNEPLDRTILEALRTNDLDALRSLDTKALESGTPEVRNWVTLGGALRGLRMNWSDYIPVYRTPAGTGIGLAFASWSQ